MKVLKNNYSTNTEKENETNPFPRKLVCEGCGSELEYEKSDIEFGAYGCGYLACPLCKYNNELYEEDEGLTLTVNNIEFPVHFYHTSLDTGAVDISNEEIKKYIQRGIDYFRKNKNEYSWCVQSGTMHLAMWRMDGEEAYDVVVSKDYYSSFIPFENVDYNPEWEYDN